MSDKGIVTVTIDDVPPSNNKFMGRRVHPAAYQKEKVHWSLLVRAGAEGIPAKPIKKAAVEIFYTFSDKRKRDPDNYSGKFLLDGLVECGILEDDSFDHIELKLRAKHKKGKKKTVITVREVTHERNG